MCEETEKYHLITNDVLDITYREIVTSLFKDKERIKILLQYLESHSSLKINMIEIQQYIIDEKNIIGMYKIDDRNIYLIILPKKRNYHLPYDILNYCIGIFQDCKKQNIMRPYIFPIVISLENQKCYKKGNHCLEMTTYDGHIMYLNYNLIDVNKILKAKDTILEELLYLEPLKQKEM